MKERFLPIGTVVMLKGGTKEIMITSYCVFSKGFMKDKSKEKEMFDYGACSYPEGILNSDIALAFNHNQIEKIIHMGYTNATFEELNRKVNEEYDNIKKQFESGQLI